MNQQFSRKRKAILFLPLITLPFITLAFWSLGGGRKTNATATTPTSLNKSLPSAQLKHSDEDKMSLYNQAALDSVNKSATSTGGQFAASDSALKRSDDSMLLSGSQGFNYGANNSDQSEEKLRLKLAELERTIRQPPPPQQPPYNSYSDRQMSASPDVARLQQMMAAMQQPAAPDPEMTQLSGMLQKILDIQHPERVSSQLKAESIKNRGRVYTLGSTGPVAIRANEGFYDITDSLGDDSLRQQAVSATVEGTQTVVSGATLKLKLSQDILISGVLIPKNSYVFGLCSVDGERLKVQISGIRSGSSLFPVSLTLYDLDANEGIRIPGAISRDASKDGADKAIQSMQLMTYDPSLGTQAAGMGIEAAKGLLSKKVKLVRVTVKAGYPVLLVDEKAKQQSQF